MTGDYLAEFKAKGGEVKRLESGIAYGIDKDADHAKRIADRAARNDNALIEQRRIASYDHRGRAVIVNGLGEIIGIE